uniref:Uncharacterized protein n=1 Tax=Chenopodium quinoa TaxID=63459 RepID=A0A803MME1_CHEQI
MANSTFTLLKAVFIALASVMVATLIYTIAIDGLPFRKDLLFPITTCTYIVIQLFKLSAEESARDPMYHLLLRQQDKKDAFSGSTLHLIAAKVIFSALGFLMLGTLVYTLITNGSPFKKELLIPWMVATLIDFYINVAVLSVNSLKLLVSLHLVATVTLPKLPRCCILWVSLATFSIAYSYGLS